MVVMMLKIIMVMDGDYYGQIFSDVHPLKTALDFSTLGVMVIGDLSFSIWTIMTLGKPSIPVPYSKPFSWSANLNHFSCGLEELNKVLYDYRQVFILTISSV